MAAAERAGLHPYRVPDRRELGALRRPAGVQQLRVLRRLRLPDRGQGRPGRAAAPRAAHRPLRDPPRELRHRDHHRRAGGRRPPACATSTPTRVEHEVRAAPRACSPPARSRRPACCCASGLGNSSGLVGRNLMYHFQTLTVGAFPQRLESMKGRCVTGAHDDHIVGDAASAAAAPRAPGCRGCAAASSSTAARPSPCARR